MLGRKIYSDKKAEEKQNINFHCKVLIINEQRVNSREISGNCKFNLKIMLVTQNNNDTYNNVKLKQESIKTNYF